MATPAKKADPKAAKNVPATTKGSNVPATINYAADAGAGFEGAGREAYAIPFLVILQSLSPQCKKSDPAYIKGAEEGDIYNSVSGELYAAGEGVRIIPCGYAQTFVEWITREKGGGFVAEHDPVSGAALRAKATRDDKSRDILPNGHQLNDTRNHYVLVEDSDGNWQPALLSLTSTQIKASRLFMSNMQRICSTNKLPMYALVYRFTTQAQKNDKGAWFGAVFEHESYVEDANAYAAAKAFNEQVRSGAVKTQPRDAAPNPDQDDPAQM
jgi:hypothetical protein